MRGTSVAAAEVAGVAALIIGALPGMPPVAVRGLIETTARPLGDPAYYGAGLVDASAAVGVSTATNGDGSGSGAGTGGDAGGDTVPFQTIDAVISSLTVPSTPVVLGDTAQINVGVRNDSSVTRTITVTLQDDASGVTVATQDLGLTSGQATTVSFSWTALAPVATHTLRAIATVSGDQNPVNNMRSADVVVNPATLQLRITPSKSSYRGGDWIFVNFNATDGGLPAASTQIDFKIFGASGYQVNAGTITTDGSGLVGIVMSRYYAFGGIGTYLVEATATRNGATTTARQTFIVTSARG
jgi:hypothetical protein